MRRITGIHQEDGVCWVGLALETSEPWLRLETSEPWLRLFTVRPTDQSVASWKGVLRVREAMEISVEPRNLEDMKEPDCFILWHKKESRCWYWSSGMASVHTLWFFSATWANVHDSSQKSDHIPTWRGRSRGKYKNLYQFQRNWEEKAPNVDISKDQGAFAPVEGKWDGLWGRSFANCGAVTGTVDP